jgi:hypothetical protein
VVFPYEEILERRRTAGLTHVIRRTHGVFLVNPALNSGAPDSGTPILGASGAPLLSAHLSNKKEEVITTTTTGNPGAPNPGTAISRTAAPIALRTLLEPHLGTIDDSALQQLWRQCRARAEDCTSREIAHFVNLKLRVSRNIQNPVGFVLQAVPKCFDNGGHLTIRELLRKQQEHTEAQWRDAYEYWQQIAQDITQPDEERVEASRQLANLEKTKP